jgi:hypothetical protein
LIQTFIAGDFGGSFGLSSEKIRNRLKMYSKEKHYLCKNLKNKANDLFYTLRLEASMIKVGIFFGGPSREREISFAGGRTVYDNLNKTLFEPVPIFIDSNRNWVLLDWQYIYKGTIRDFYPPVESLPPSPNQFQIYIESLGKLSEEALEKLISKVGRRILPHEIDQWIDVAFLALHGEYGEDGQIQGFLESMGVPYTGSGIRPCTIGMDKGFQKKMMEAGGFECPAVMELHRDDWIERRYRTAFSGCQRERSARHWWCARPIRVRLSAYLFLMRKKGLPFLKKLSIGLFSLKPFMVPTGINRHAPRSLPTCEN